MSEAKPDDLLAILDGFVPLREAWRGMVANLIDDGWTDEQARILMVNTFTGYRWNNGTDQTDDGGPA